VVDLGVGLKLQVKKVEEEVTYFPETYLASYKGTFDSSSAVY